jgi:hypothetical protein
VFRTWQILVSNSATYGTHLNTIQHLPLYFVLPKNSGSHKNSNKNSSRSKEISLSLKEMSLSIKEEEKSIDELNKLLYKQAEIIKSLKEQLSRFNKLDKKGNVYSDKREGDKLTFLELISEVLGSDMKKYWKYFNFSLRDTKDGGQYRSRKQRLILTKYLKLTKLLARQHYKEFNKTASRFKGLIKIGDMVKGKVGIYNEYPKNYTQYISQYIDENPLEEWANYPMYISEVISDTDTMNVFCSKCEKTFQYASLSSHLKTKKHLSG